MKKSVRKKSDFLPILLMLLSLSAPKEINAQFFPGDTVREGIYKDNIRSVLLFREGWRLSYPIIDLRGETDLILKFDDLSQEIRNYNYKIIHCDSEWRPTPLSESDYLDGNLQNQIDDYDYSFNTYTSYIHYTLNLPNPDVRFRISGNYALLVYENFDENDLVLVRRFMVAEKIMNVDVNIQRPVMSVYRDIGHQINFSIGYGSFRIDDPFKDIKVRILQNGRWDNSIDDVKPLFDRNGILDYDYQLENVFMAGREFRWFDIKSMRYKSPYVKNIEFENDRFHVQLFPDEPRDNKPYFFEDDLNGKFFIEIQEEENSDTDADYVDVYFSLPWTEPLVEGDFYIFGGLTNWQLNDKNRMQYNFETKSYHLTLSLKQGYYNYQIAYAPAGSDKADLGYVEGNFYETENDYIILVYFYGTTSRYERIVGYQISNSLRRE